MGVSDCKSPEKIATWVCNKVEGKYVAGPPTNDYAAEAPDW